MAATWYVLYFARETDFRIVLLLLPGSQIAVWHFRDLLFALVLFCHTNPRGDTMLSSLLIRFK